MKVHLKSPTSSKGLIMEMVSSMEQGVALYKWVGCNEKVTTLSNNLLCSLLTGNWGKGETSSLYHCTASGFSINYNKLKKDLSRNYSMCTNCNKHPRATLRILLPIVICPKTCDSNQMGPWLCNKINLRTILFLAPGYCRVSKILLPHPP